jgi:imidazoleglycerol phosphate synthase glutamine amidotransferase subunit HisH
MVLNIYLILLRNVWVQHVGTGLNLVVQCFPEYSFYKYFLTCLVKNALLYFCVNLQILFEKGKEKKFETSMSLLRDEKFYSL